MSHEIGFGNIQKNTYLTKLGAMREINPPWNWKEEPAQLAMSPDMLNDPAYSFYDLGNIRTYEQDPSLRDARTLRSERALSDVLGTQFSSAGYTYNPDFSVYDPNKIYISGLEDLKPAVGPLAEQEKQGAINKELASTISHEFRHTMFDDPKYSGIIESLYNKFGGGMSYYDINEMVNRAADVQLMPESWLGQTLEDFQENYNKKLMRRGKPAHLNPVTTTKYFDRAATSFFDRVKQEKIKQQQAQQWQEMKNKEMVKAPVTITPSGGGGGGWSPSGADLTPGGGYGRSPTGRDIAGTPFYTGGLAYLLRE